MFNKNLISSYQWCSFPSWCSFRIWHHELQFPIRHSTNEEFACCIRTQKDNLILILVLYHVPFILPWLKLKFEIHQQLLTILPKNDKYQLGVRLWLNRLVLKRPLALSPSLVNTNKKTKFFFLFFFLELRVVCPTNKIIWTIICPSSKPVIFYQRNATFPAFWTQ